MTTMRVHKGFTLVELVMSMAILAVVLVAANSVVILAARAIPDGKGRNSSLIQTGRAADVIGADLAYATSVVTSTATAVEFVLPDRDGNGMPDAVRYNWSGVAGDPLTRQYKRDASLAGWAGVPAVVVAENVQEFQLAYDKRAVQQPPTYTEGAETLLASYSPPLGLTLQKVSDNHYTGQYFRPTLPANTFSWGVTRVTFFAASAGATDGENSIQIRTATAAGLPTAYVLEETPMLESTLAATPTVQQFTFTSVRGIPPSDGLCLVVEQVSHADSCAVQIVATGATYLGGGLVITSNGVDWTAPLAQDMAFSVYGKIVTPDPPVTKYALTGVRLAIRAGTNAAARLTTSIRVLNQPQVDGP